MRILSTRNIISNLRAYEIQSNHLLTCVGRLKDQLAGDESSQANMHCAVRVPYLSAHRTSNR